MNCRDYERLWNERLDARDAVADGPDRAMDDHALSCLPCQALGLRYQVLAHSVRSLGPISGPSPGFADRVLAAEGVAPVVVGRLPSHHRRTALAAAAVVVLGLTLGVSRFGTFERAIPEPPPPTAALVRVNDPTDLSEALAEARSATWDLAMEASAPAARVGRQVLGSARIPDAEAVPELSLPEGVAVAADVWRTMEDRVNAGVRPLGGSARHAFGFLLGVAPDADHPPALPAKGA